MQYYCKCSTHFLPNYLAMDKEQEICVPPTPPHRPSCLIQIQIYNRSGDRFKFILFIFWLWYFWFFFLLFLYIRKYIYLALLGLQISLSLSQVGSQLALYHAQRDVKLQGRIEDKGYESLTCIYHNRQPCWNYKTMNLWIRSVPLETSY